MYISARKKSVAGSSSNKSNGISKSKGKSSGTVMGPNDIQMPTTSPVTHAAPQSATVIIQTVKEGVKGKR